jgi:hypothetical protein
MAAEPIRIDYDTTLASLTVPKGLIPLFHRQAHETLEFAAANLAEAINWQRRRHERGSQDDTGRSPEDLEAHIAYERAKVRTADALLRQVDEHVGRGGLTVEAERRHLYNTVQGCLLSQCEAARDAIESLDGDDRVRPLLEMTGQWVQIRDALMAEHIADQPVSAAA